MVHKILNVSKLLLTKILRSPGYHLGQGLNKVTYSTYTRIIILIATQPL